MSLLLKLYINREIDKILTTNPLLLQAIKQNDQLHQIADQLHTMIQFDNLPFKQTDITDHITYVIKTIAERWKTKKNANKKRNKRRNRNKNEQKQEQKQE